MSMSKMVEGKLVFLGGRFKGYTHARISALLHEINGTVTKSANRAEVALFHAPDHPRHEELDALGVVCLAGDDVLTLLTELEEGEGSGEETPEEEEAPTRSRDAILSDMRSVLQGSGDYEARWSALKKLFEAWPDDEVETPTAYCLREVSSWPAHERMAPTAWVERLMERGEDPRMALAGLLSVTTNATPEQPTRVALLEKIAAYPHIKAVNINHTSLTPERLEELLKTRGMQQMTRLNLMYNQLGAQGVRHIVGWPGCAALTYLDLRDNQLGAEGAEVLASAPFASLETLELYKNELGDAGARHLASSERLRTVRDLTLEYNYLNETGWRVLVTSPLFDGLRRLSVKYNELYARGAALFADASTLAQLEELDVGANEIGDEGVAHLANGEAMRNLKVLRVAGNWVNPLVTDEGARALAENTSLGALRELDLECNPLTEEGLEALLTSPRLASLESLRISHARINLARAHVLTRDDLPVKLKHLNLIYAKREGSAAEVLRNARAFRTLDTLELSGLEFDAKELSALLENEHLTGLKKLDLNDTKLTIAVARQLAAYPFANLRELNLYKFNVGLSTGAARAIVNAPWFSGLRFIHFSAHNKLAEAIVREAAAAHNMIVVAY